MQQGKDNISSENFDNRSVACETAGPVAIMIIDAFHEKSFNQVSFRYDCVP